MKTVLAFIALMLGLHSCAGHQSFEEGEYREAAEAFRRSADSSGSGWAWFNLGVAALRAGDLPDAEQAAERAVVAGGPSFRSNRDFILGLIQTERFTKAEMLAKLPEAGQPEMDNALRLASNAIWQFERAIIEKDAPWPKAMRNIERLWIRVGVLQAVEAKARKKQGKSTRSKPIQPRPSRKQPTRSDNPIQFNSKPLNQEAVARVRKKLAGIAHRKMQLRRAAQESRSPAGGRDW